MSDKTKIIILKSAIAISMFFCVLIFVIPFLAAIFCDQSEYDSMPSHMPFPEPFNSIWIADLIAFASFTIFFMILMSTMKLENKPKPYKYPLGYPDFSSLETFITDAVTKNAYARQADTFFEPDGKTTLFIKSAGLWKIDCIALIRTKELTNEVLENANDSITEALYKYYGKEKITDTVSMISIICVDRITPAFQKLMNSNVEQGIKNFRLPTGISFGGKQIYIPRQDDGFAIAKYKKLRKEFMKIMNLTKDQCINPPESRKKKNK